MQEAIKIKDNVKKLKKGQVIKNYKELCNILGVKVKGGKSKIIQLKELERYVKYTKDNYKFIILDVYTISKPPILKSNKTNYIENIEQLILNLLSKENSNSVFLSKNILFKQLNMINYNYINYNYKHKRLSKLLKVSENNVNEFYNLNNTMLKRNVEKALDNLENKRLIFWNKEITVCEITPEKNVLEKKEKINRYDEILTDYTFYSKAVQYHREATEQEKTYILELENNEMKKLDCKNIQEIIKKGYWDSFKKKINKKLLDNFKIAYYYKSYKIVFSKKVVTQKCIYELYDKKYNTITKELNKSIIKKINLNTENRYNKALARLADNTLKDNIKHRTSKKYLRDHRTLTKNLIKEGAKKV